VVYKPINVSDLLAKIGRHLGVQLSAPHPPGGSIRKLSDHGGAAVTPADLMVLPVAWIEEFSRTLRRGRSAELLTLIEEIRPAQADLAEALAGLVRIHEFDQLIALAGGAGKGASHG